MRSPQHPDEHRSKRPVLLAVDQEFGKGATPVLPNFRRGGADSLEQPHGSIRIESRMARSSARSLGGEPGDLPAAIIRRVPSTSRIQNSSL